MSRGRSKGNHCAYPPCPMEYFGASLTSCKGNHSMRFWHAATWVCANMPATKTQSLHRDLHRAASDTRCACIGVRIKRPPLLPHRARGAFGARPCVAIRRPALDRLLGGTTCLTLSNPCPFHASLFVPRITMSYRHLRRCQRRKTSSRRQV